ncbi:MAG: GNAT family N-acetyltransferase [Blastocatellia bacterium]|nr:GNAT family N-acetyltransferase [Blastocatellia bacterium]
MIDGKQLPDIFASRVRLRWLTLADVDDLFAVFGDPEVMRYWSCPAFENRDEARELVDEIHRFFSEKSLFQWGIEHLESGRIIGTCTLAEVSERNRRAELGFALGRSSWGHGYSAEAVTALLDFAFQTLDLHRVEADADPRNDSSIRLLERLGFVREGTLRERWLVGGEVQDSAFFGLLRREWGAKVRVDG